MDLKTHDGVMFGLNETDQKIAATWRTAKWLKLLVGDITTMLSAFWTHILPGEHSGVRKWRTGVIAGVGKIIGADEPFLMQALLQPPLDMQSQGNSSVRPEFDRVYQGLWLTYRAMVPAFHQLSQRNSAAPMESTNANAQYTCDLMDVANPALYEVVKLINSHRENTKKAADTEAKENKEKEAQAKEAEAKEKEAQAKESQAKEREAIAKEKEAKERAAMSATDVKGFAPVSQAVITATEIDPGPCTCFFLRLLFDLD
jgi:hypothetical protein